MARNASGSKSKSPFLGGFLLGLFVGLALALVVALTVTKNNPFVSGPAQPTAPSGQQPTGQVKPAEAPSYDFYKSLPPNTGNVTEGAAASPPPAVEPKPLWLQAGAFQNQEDADNLKARLALLGVEATIGTAEIPEKGTLYRVRIGPLKSQEELEATRSRLTENSIPAEPVKN